jgi:hypothetical protein
MDNFNRQGPIPSRDAVGQSERAQWSNTVTCSWEIRDVVRDKPDVGSFLKNVLTLTARQEYIEAAACRSHLHKSYGSIALALLEGIIGALKSANGIYGS